MDVDTCRYKHVDEICVDKNCSVFQCERRHPRIFNYYREYQRCKFTTFCRYKHENLDNENEKINQIEIRLKKN